MNLLHPINPLFTFVSNAGHAQKFTLTVFELLRVTTYSHYLDRALWACLWPNKKKSSTKTKQTNDFSVFTLVCILMSLRLKCNQYHSLHYSLLHSRHYVLNVMQPIRLYCNRFSNTLSLTCFDSKWCVTSSRCNFLWQTPYTYSIVSLLLVAAVLWHSSVYRFNWFNVK